MLDSGLLFLIVGAFIGFLASFFYFRFLLLKKQQKNDQNWADKIETLASEKQEAENKLLTLNERLAFNQSVIEKNETELTNTKKINENLSAQVVRNESEYKNLQEKLEVQKSELEELQKKFTVEFENIANKILKKNSEEFTAANQQKLGEVLNPLKEKLQQFEKKVDDTYQKGLKDQVDLKAELKKLSDLNVKISEEARNLTRALKGDVKKQGNWGEIILERILERSGLKEGEEYKKQFSGISENGKRIQPDIVVMLPDDKHIIIDSKVSLVAYERAVNAQSEKDREKNIREHLHSLKTHIKGLSEKHYQSAKDLNSPDFVLMFIPVEASFSIAIQEDQELFTFAWDQKVVIVSPSTLLATLRTIASIWQQENQTRNAMEIARQGGALYDKFVGFLSDMNKIGNHIASTQKTYQDAMNKLQTGSGNLIRRVENIKKLGAKASKELPHNLSEE